MNILIIGGLLGLAIVAILGAVLLGISEDRAAKAQNTAATLLPQQSQSRQLASQAVPATPVVVRTTGQLPSLNEEEPLASLNGQVREITGELRILAQKAGELEQRLSDLSELLERQQLHQADTPDQLYEQRTDSSSL